MWIFYPFKMFLFFLQVSRKGAQNMKNLRIWGQIHSKVEGMMQSYPPRILDRRLQEEFDRAAKEGLRVLMNLRVDLLSPWAKVGSTLLYKY